MACLAPQLKWPLSTRAAAFREHGGAGIGGFRTVRLHCAVSTTALVEAESSDSLAPGARRLVVYDGAVAPPPLPVTSFRCVPG